MTTSQFEVFMIWLMTIITVSLLVLSVAPSMARSLFRERIDAIIDDCHDAMLDERLSPSPAVDSFLSDLRTFKNVARQLTLHRVGMIVVALQEIGVDFSDHHSPSFAQLAPSQRRLLHTLMGRTNNALASYLRWGSPLGWFLGSMAAIVMRPMKPRRRRKPRTLPALDVETVAERFNQTGAVHELRPRRRLHLVA